MSQPKPTSSARPATTSTGSVGLDVVHHVGPMIARRVGERDGAELLVVGGARVEAKDGSVEVSRDLFHDAIRIAVPVERGWLFVAEDGAVARAKTFLGELEVLDDLPRTANPPSPSAGRLAVTTTEGAVWSTDGVGPFVRLAAAPERARAVAFRDAMNGAMVFDPGHIAVTKDGGKSWKPVGFDVPNAAGTIAHDRQRLLVATQRGRMELRPDLSLVPAGSRGGTAAKLDQITERVEEALAQQDPTFAIRGERVVLSDGTVLSFENQTVTRRSARGKVLSVVGKTRGHATCGLRPWGKNGAHLDCSHDTSYVVTDGRVTPVRPTGALFDAVASADGRFIAQLVCLDDSARFRPDASACEKLGIATLWHPSLEWSVAPTNVRTKPIAAHSRGILFLEKREYAARLVDPRTGAARNVALPQAPGQVELRSGTFAPDGTLVLQTQSTHSSDHTRSMITEVSGKPARVSALPAGAEDLVFSDALHGVAIGDRLEYTHITTNGGTEWRPLPIAGRGRVGCGSVRMRYPTRGVCTQTYCTAGDLVIRWNAPLASRREPVFAKRAGSQCREWGDSPTFQNLRCQGTGVARAVSVSGTPTPQTDERIVQLARGAGALAAIEIQRARRNADETSVHVRWKLLDGSGGESRRAELAWPDPDAEWKTDRAPEYHVVAAASNRVLIERCQTSAPCALVVARSGKPVRVVDTSTVLSGTSLGQSESTLAIPLDDGFLVDVDLGQLGEYSFLPHTYAPSVGAVMKIDADARPLHLDFFASTEGRALVTTTSGAGVGLYERRTGALEVFATPSRGVLKSGLSLSLSAPRVCASPAGVTSMFFRPRDETTYSFNVSFDGFLLEFEIDRAGNGCVRSMRDVPRLVSRPAAEHPVVLLRAQGGKLRGTVQGRERAERMECTVSPR